MAVYKDENGNFRLGVWSGKIDERGRTMTKPKCETCEWWDRDEICPEEGENFSVCRKNAPRPLSENDKFFARGKDVPSQWPETNGDDWCGEHSDNAKQPESLQYYVSPDTWAMMQPSASKKSPASGLWVEGPPQDGNKAFFVDDDGAPWAAYIIGGEAIDSSGEPICKSDEITRHIPLSALIGEEK